MRVLVLLVLLTGCASEAYRRVRTCENCPTTRDHKRYVCRSETGSFRACGRKIEVLVPVPFEVMYPPTVCADPPEEVNPQPEEVE